MSMRQVPPADHKLAYFVPRQIILVIEHDGALDRKPLLELLRGSEQALGGPRIARPHRLLTFPRSRNSPPTTLVFTAIERISDEPAELLRLLERLERYLGQSSGGLTLRNISPNWLSSRAPHFVTGGPGSQPVPADALDPIWQHVPLETPDAPFGFATPSVKRGHRARQQVEVAILDTAPCPHELAAAYHRWSHEHPLIRSLLRVGGSLRINYAAYPDLLRLASYQIEDHSYNMADHGLFVAGIIHTIAPNANLQLIEVLNPSGVGDIESVAVGLQQVLRRRSRAPLVVNCSFVINFPTQEELDELAANDPIWRWLTPERQARMAASAQNVFDAVSHNNVPIVAAAGNDGDIGKPRPPARYPAAFRSVIGVGALDEHNQPTEYSNLADTPVEEGIATFGGAANQGKAVKGDGVLGVYIGEFPDGTRNTNGWAWWAGTSFAAPIISGSLAALIAQGQTQPDALHTLRSAESATTSANEEILSADQP